MDLIYFSSLNQSYMLSLRNFIQSGALPVSFSCLLRHEENTLALFLLPATTVEHCFVVHVVGCPPKLGEMAKVYR